MDDEGISKVLFIFMGIGCSLVVASALSFLFLPYEEKTVPCYDSQNSLIIDLECRGNVRSGELFGYPAQDTLYTLWALGFGIAMISAIASIVLTMRRIQ